MFRRQSRGNLADSNIRRGDENSQNRTADLDALLFSPLERRAVRRACVITAVAPADLSLSSRPHRPAAAAAARRFRSFPTGYSL